MIVLQNGSFGSIFWVDMQKFQLIPFHVGGSCNVGRLISWAPRRTTTTTSPSQISTSRTEMSTDPQATRTCLITYICKCISLNLGFKKISEILTVTIRGGSLQPMTHKCAYFGSLTRLYPKTSSRVIRKKPITFHFLKIQALGCREPARMVGGVLVNFLVWLLLNLNWSTLQCITQAILYRYHIVTAPSQWSQMKSQNLWISSRLKALV